MLFARTDALVRAARIDLTVRVPATIEEAALIEQVMAPVRGKRAKAAVAPAPPPTDITGRAGQLPLAPVFAR